MQNFHQIRLDPRRSGRTGEAHGLLPGRSPRARRNCASLRMRLRPSGARRTGRHILVDGECTRATRRRPAGRVLLVTSEAGPRLPGRSGSPRPRWPFSVPTGLRLPAPAPGRHGRSHSAACTMPGAGQWAATHPRRLPSRPLVSEEPPWRPAELTKHSGPPQAWQPFPATRGSHGAAGDVSQRAARWDSPVRAPRPPTSTHALGSPPPDVCGAPPACERDTR